MNDFDSRDGGWIVRFFYIDTAGDWLFSFRSFVDTEPSERHRPFAVEQ